jgi:hypothetical protein
MKKPQSIIPRKLSIRSAESKIVDFVLRVGAPGVAPLSVRACQRDTHPVHSDIRTRRERGRQIKKRIGPAPRRLEANHGQSAAYSTCETQG